MFICLAYKKKYRITKKLHALQLFSHWSCSWIFAPCRSGEALRGPFMCTFPYTLSLLVQIGYQPSCPPSLISLLDLNLYVHHHSFTLPNSTLKMEVVYTTAHFHIVRRAENRSRSTMNHFESRKSVRLLLSFLLSAYPIQSETAHVLYVIENMKIGCAL
jgi:hypothetical protein